MHLIKVKISKNPFVMFIDADLSVKKNDIISSIIIENKIL